MSSTPPIFVGTVRQVPGIRPVAADHTAHTITVLADDQVHRADVDAGIARTGHTPAPLH